MFPIHARKELPVARILIHSFAVRGSLGPVSVWVYRGVNVDLHQVHLDIPEHWISVYEREHGPSRRNYERLDFSSNPIVLLPGETKIVYIHSRAPHDRGIVYDNTSSSQRGLAGRPRYQDSLIEIQTGKAHLSPIPFGRENIWGWGTAWRDYREFVGQVHYGAVYQLWQPELHLRYGTHFQNATHMMFLCQRRWESPISMLPDECIFYILNMCRWDWFDDNSASLSLKLKRRSKRSRQKRQDRELAVPRLISRRPWRFGYATIRDKLKSSLG